MAPEYCAVHTSNTDTENRTIRFCDSEENDKNHTQKARESDEGDEGIPESPDDGRDWEAVSRADVRLAALEHAAACVELLVLPAGRACEDIAPDAVLAGVLSGPGAAAAPSRRGLRGLGARLRLHARLCARTRSPRTALGAAGRVVSAAYCARGHVGAAVRAAHVALLVARVAATWTLLSAAVPFPL